MYREKAFEWKKAVVISSPESITCSFCDETISKFDGESYVPLEVTRGKSMFVIGWISKEKNCKAGLAK